ncbi:uncharacterized protein [Temnothorax nylanderi]|uniref:uncharacterized protein n=1 Tax=Temnothorax nylanderi TaxID=102681 RepID=UPI003A88EF6B
MKAMALIATKNMEYDILRRFSDYGKLQRIMAYWLRFKANSFGAKKSGPLTPDELELAETNILKITQREVFPKEITSLDKQTSFFLILIHFSMELAHYMPGLGLIVDKPKTGSSGNTNDGNTARRAFKNADIFADCLQIDHRLLYVSLYPWFPMPSTIHKILIHSGDIIRHSGLPVGMFGEEASESRNKDYRHFRLSHSRHFSRKTNLEDLFYRVMDTSDPIVSSMSMTSRMSKRKRLPLSTEVTQLLLIDADEEEQDSDNDGSTTEEKKHEEIANYLARQKIEWRFIPPRSPHFGGLWEAAVKATKRHLHTVTKGLVWTFEEYYTLLVEIEAILNSRPLTSLSSDPNNLLVLTPSHFLTEDSLLFPPEYSYLNVSDNKLSRWQHAQKLRQHFWKRWQEEYLHELQRRHKWRTKGKDLEVGTLVILKEDNVPPLQWVLGQVEEVHPCKDDVVRVATVRTPTGLLKKAVTKLCPLPAEEDC